MGIRGHSTGTEAIGEGCNNFHLHQFEKAFTSLERKAIPAW
jgi:hypothetical protein